MKLKITFIIPLVLFVLSLNFSLIFYWQTKSQAADIIRQQDQLKIKLDVTRLQNILYNLLTEDHTDLAHARLNLSITAMDSSIKTLMLVNQDDIVFMSNRYNWEGLRADTVSDYEINTATYARKNSKPNLFFHDKKETLLHGYYPVVLHLENKFGEPKKQRGVLYIEYKLTNKLAKAERVALIQSITIAVVALASSLLIALILHFAISRRLSKLTEVSEIVSSGNLDIKTGIGGNDELYELSNAFDEMIDRIKDDINKREEVEKELTHVNENLEQIVEKRTGELEEKRKELMKAQAVAHHANKMTALGEMAGGMAHEINSPLQAINLLTYKLRKENLSGALEKREKIAEDIEASVFRISNIIESLRKMSRGDFSDPFSEVTVKEVIDNVIGITKERYSIKGIKFNLIYCDGCEDLELYCQQTLIGQVIMNLLNNSYDAVLNLKDKWINLEIYADDDNVLFTVTDSGNINKNLAKNVFEPMFTTKEIGEGTGLGLSISLDIARKHNGNLTLNESSENTKFVLTVPRKQNNEE